MLINFLKIIISIASVKLSHGSCIKERLAKNARHDYAQRGEAECQSNESQQGTMERERYAISSVSLAIFRHTNYHLI